MFGIYLVLSYVIFLIIIKFFCVNFKEICVWGEVEVKVLRSIFEVFLNVCCFVFLRKRDCVRGLFVLFL